jgi:hypothetical protein
MVLDMEIFILAVLLGLIPAAIAHGKGHSFFGWWIFGAALWIIALPCSLLLKQNHDHEKQCPACREYVVKEANVCKHCRYVFAPVSAQMSSSSS